MDKYPFNIGHEYLLQLIKDLMAIAKAKGNIISEIIIERLRGFTCAENIAVFRVDKNDGLYLLKADVAAAKDYSEMHENIFKTVTAYLKNRDISIHASNIESSKPNLKDKKERTLYFLCIPFVVDGELIAVCYLDGIKIPSIVNSKKINVLEAYCTACALALELAFIKNKENNIPDMPISRLCYGKKKMEEVVEYVKKNYQNEISNDDVAFEFSLHPDYLSRQFKLFTGKTVKEYINNLRVAEAADKIRNTEKKVIEIAMAVGFGSLRTFNRNFRCIIGTGPMEYRRKIIASSR